MKNSGYCVFIILVMQLPIAFMHGVNLLAMNTPTPAIRNFINQSYIERFGQIPEETTVTLIMTLIHSTLIWGTLIGSLLAQATLKRLSGKKSVLMIHAVNILSVVFMGPVSFYALSYEALIIGRALAGMSRGIGYTIIIVIVAEFTSRSDMGFFQTPYLLSISISSAFTAGIGHHEVLGNEENWMWIVCLPALGSVIYFIAYRWIPQSPVSLLRKKKREKALIVLKSLRKRRVDIKAELDIWENEINEITTDQSTPMRSIIRDKRLRLQFLTVLIISISSQMAGLQGISLYSNEIFLRAGVDQKYATFATMSIHLLASVAYIAFVPLEKRIGTKKIFVIGTTVCFFSLFVFTIINGFAHSSSWLSYLALAAMFSNMLAMFFGPILCKNSLSAELTTAASRPTIAFYSSCAFWIIGAITAFVFPYSIDELGTYAWVPYVIFTLVMIPFAIFYIPDTHNRNNAQIQKSFRKKSVQSISTVLGFSGKRMSENYQENKNYINKSYMESD